LSGAVYTIHPQLLDPGAATPEDEGAEDFIGWTI
jgi:hypothetical protein